MKICSFLLIAFITSCNGQNRISLLYPGSVDSIKATVQSIAMADWSKNFIFPQTYRPENDLSIQVSQYIRRVYQDKKGDIWFGTQGDGACRYEGSRLIYYTTREGFGGDVIRGITEDESGNLWFATNGGVTRFDAGRQNSRCYTNTCKHDLQRADDADEHNNELAKSITRFTVKDGLANNDVWSILKDNKGNLWFGTMGGVSRYDGKTFTAFAIPKADVAYHSRFSPNLVWSIYEDRKGNIWFGTDGGGVRKYDGRTLTAYTTKEGLTDNNVGCILEDKAGNIWFGTRFGGVSRFDGKSFTSYTEKDGLCHDFIWTMYEDNAGKLWFGSAGGGASRYDGNHFTNFSNLDGLNSKHIQSILQDRQGFIWFGTSGGVFRYDGISFINFRKPGC